MRHRAFTAALLALALLVCLTLSGCGLSRPVTRFLDTAPMAPAATPGAAEAAPSVADIEAELQAVQARAAGLEVALAAAQAAEQRARVESLQLKLWYAAGLGALSFLIGLVLLMTGIVARRWAGICIVGGLTLAGGAIAFSWLVPWLLAIGGPMLGVLILAAIVAAVWRHRQLATSALSFDAKEYDQADPQIAGQIAAAIPRDLQRLLRIERRPVAPSGGPNNGPTR